MSTIATRPRARALRLSRQEQQVLAEARSLGASIAAAGEDLPPGQLLDPAGFRRLARLLRAQQPPSPVPHPAPSIAVPVGPSKPSNGGST